jgi:hypothetical protein
MPYCMLMTWMRIHIRIHGVAMAMLSRTLNRSGRRFCLPMALPTAAMRLDSTTAASYCCRFVRCPTVSMLWRP